VPKISVTMLNCESKSLKFSRLELPSRHAKINPGLRAHVAAGGRSEGFIQKGQIYVTEIAAGMDSAQRLLFVLPSSPFAVVRSFNSLCSLPSISGNIFPVLPHLHMAKETISSMPNGTN